MQRPWSLYNKEEKLRIDDLKSEHVRIILLAIPTVRMSDWYACQEGDVHWQPIGEIPEFYEDVRQLKGKNAADAKVYQAPVEEKSQPFVPKSQVRRPLFEDAPEGLNDTGKTLQVDLARTKERRTTRRYTRQLMFKVSKNGKKFECETEDISMAGVSLLSPLPDWLPNSFKAELHFNKSKVKVMCARVSATQLKFVDAESWDVIRSWIVNW
jgi:hypothetical protein